MPTEARSRGHSREDVVRAALHILDEYGLPDLTMRRLSPALCIQPSALYWHFSNKQSMLAELSDRIVSRGLPAQAESEWTTQVRTAAAALRDALLTYRDGAEVVLSTLALRLGSTVAHDRLASAIAAGGFDDIIIDQAATTLLHFVLGHVSHEQQRMQYDSLGALTETPAGAPRGAPTPATEFAFGVDLLVGGLQFSYRPSGTETAPTQPHLHR
ncbi:TetR/AcrR family transcriptional regulator C-terminal domain-containing protein [Glaciibacter superstes]|uniref:TetR/AcrR family transcriptional regulator C-terminal domain-containing protein n=1 Tax=Glaciibacter superstes TaxID=501023 RepID=UPI0003B2E8B1|nr:TetR/AcrR family transcriptional regulator C-terminal domain-containing protein [Glaciibacter superstes]